MLEDSQFHCLADAYLDALADTIEEKDPHGVVDVDREGSTLTITLPSGRQYVVNKHLPTRQIWLSSPVSGGLHFSYNEEDSLWQLEDGRRLCDILASEFKDQIGIRFEFAS